VVFPNLHGVHGTFAFAPGYVLVGGLGGTIEDEADSVREETLRLSYPGWELDYRLKFFEGVAGLSEDFLVFQTHQRTRDFLTREVKR